MALGWIDLGIRNRRPFPYMAVYVKSWSRYRPKFRAHGFRPKTPVLHIYTLVTEGHCLSESLAVYDVFTVFRWRPALSWGFR